MSDLISSADWKRAFDTLTPKLNCPEEAFRHSKAMESLKMARALKLKRQAEEWDRDRPHAALQMIILELANLERMSQKTKTLMDEPYLALAMVVQQLENSLAFAKKQIKGYNIDNEVAEAAKRLKN